MYRVKAFLLATLLSTTAVAYPQKLTACASNPTVTVTSVKYKTSTTTFMTGTAPTSYVFLPGSPSSSSSSSVSTSAPMLEKQAEVRSSIRAIQTDGHQQPESTCVPPKTSTVTAVLIITVTRTKTVSPSTKTVTSYPCASPVDSQGPTYGDANSTTDLGLHNSIYPLDTPEGVDATTCCNTCFFELQNCVQAYWYFYEGCVVAVANASDVGTGRHVTHQCPAGTLKTLTYGPDVKPAFRSSGNIAGPCGNKYTNF